MRTFELVRHEDETGVSGTGVVAEGVEFTDGVVALRWLSEWPTSVVFHDRGMEAVEKVHGHGGKTEIRWTTLSVRSCCGQRHFGPVCPDGKVMCCLCFGRFGVDDLNVVGGKIEDVCTGCAAKEAGS